MIQEQSAHYSTLLEQGSAALGFPLTESQIKQLLDYLALFIKWNGSYNLSAIRDPLEMINKHLLDSLSIAPFIARSKGSRYIDVGTGGGLPGIPMAICFPEKQFTLLDSAGKKTRFLFQVKQSLALANVSIENTRVEHHRPDDKNSNLLHDGVLSRAFTSLAQMTSFCKHLITPEGEFWAMKGVYPKHELSELEKHYIVVDCHRLQVPGDIGERCLVHIKPLSNQ
ncbi:MAG: 16S rRNA (guanine527-N7)-methyltransferase [Lentisphaeria bacterium]|jgi:16S rRNA (guanine527-N7)-methyltransferase